ncbi:MAG TPA: HAD family hydrolase [Mucilaginibacter sp.]|jgi:putative hydrolase of the HAD superfamily|nr:HAD family hydrolase [Mucilaginibacter sp.]
MKRALIFDLDNTIYPVSAIAENLFKQLFALIDEKAVHLSAETIVAAKDDLKRRHYHLVAEKFGFGAALTDEGDRLLKEMTYDLPMQPFEDYACLKKLPQDKFLVTMGFTKLQWSKVEHLGIKDDFKEIHIVDPGLSNQTKKDVFADIMERHQYKKKEVLVIGDDPESEIKAAVELGIDTFLFDPNDKHLNATVTHRSASLKEVISILRS